MRKKLEGLKVLVLGVVHLVARTLQRMLCVYCNRLHSRGGKMARGARKHLEAEAIVIGPIEELWMPVVGHVNQGYHNVDVCLSEDLILPELRHLLPA